MRPFGAMILVLLASALLAGCRQCGNEPSSSPSSSSGASSLGATAQAGPAPNKASLKAPPPAGKPNDRAALGTNLGAVTDWSTERPLIDVFRMSRPFFSGSAEAWHDERPLDLDEHGWVRSLKPGQYARSLMFVDMNSFPKGRYLVLYEGKGKLRYEGSARLDAEASKPGRDVLDLDPARGDTGLILTLTATDPKDPIRDIRVVSPGGACEQDTTRFCDANTACPSGACLDFETHHEKLIFHPDFLSRTAPYGMLRFMDTMETNGSKVQHWEDRPRVDDPTWTLGGGMPLPIMAKLANQLHAQPWFCIPHEADDNYVRQFAKQAKELVDPSLPIWIEYSNEVWNGMFEQSRYAAKRGQQLKSGDAFQGQLHYYAKRSLEIFRIVEKELGPDRLVRVVASQSGNAWTSGEILGYPGVSEHTDALAIAPYFGWLPSGEDLPEVHKKSVNDVLAYARDKALPAVRKHMQEHAKIAREHGVKLVAYEAGQHFVGVMGGENDEHLNRIFDEANRHPEMKALYLAYLKSWKDAGGLWLNHYLNCGAWSKWGRWGALEYLNQPREKAPKYDALMIFMDDTPRWW